MKQEHSYREEGKGEIKHDRENEYLRKKDER
jgi:hypothetical protein